MPVLAAEPKGEKNAILVMEDGRRIWTPELDKAKELVGKEIPSDWTQKEGNYGPQALPPKGKGAMPAAFRNTKEGQAVEQDAMNRRTALMQAVILDPTPATVLPLAEDLYSWLTRQQFAVDYVTRKTSAAAGTGTPRENGTASSLQSAGGGGSTSAAERNEGSDQAADKAGGGGAIPGEEVAPPPSDDCTHPAGSRRETPSGRLRCTLCKRMVD